MKFKKTASGAGDDESGDRMEKSSEHHGCNI